MFTGILGTVLLFVSMITLSGIAKNSSNANISLCPRSYLAPNKLSPSNTHLCGTIAAGLKLRFKNYQQPRYAKQNKTLSHLAILLLSISCDVETNPGPDYPCGSCGSEVLDSDPAVDCDSCGMWFHLQCQGLDTAWYQQLVDHDQSFAWTCTAYDNLNYSNVSSILSVSSLNSFSSLPDENMQIPNNAGRHDHSSEPSQNKCKFISKLKILCVNCQSIVNKKHEFQNMIQTHNPDIVTATESWLKKEHFTSEIFPSTLGYSVFRRDRPIGKGGGVFIMVKNNLLPSEQPKLNTDCEIIWIKLEIKGTKPLYISSYYKPSESDAKSLLEFEKSLELVRSLKGTKLIFGDFNLPKLAWDSQHTPSFKPGCSTNAVYDKFLEVLDDHSLTQMVSENTRNDNILDFFLISNHTLVKKVEIIPGISDHDIISTIVNARPTILKQKPRTCHLYNKANWSEFRKHVKTSIDELLQICDSLSVEDLWTQFKNILEAGIAKYVPLKRIGFKKSLPWVNKEIKKLIHKRDHLYQKAKRNRNNHEQWNKFKKLKSLIRTKIKKSYNSYLEHILDIADTDGTDTQCKFSSKNLYTLIKKL